MRACSVAFATLGLVAVPRLDAQRPFDLASVSVPRPSSPAPLERPARLSVADAPLPEALIQLERSSGVALAYSPSLLAPAGRVTCACEHSTVGEALDRMLDGTGFRYVPIGERVVVERVERRPASPADAHDPAVAVSEHAASPGGLLDRVRTIFRQAEGRIEGRVTEAESGAPVSGAQVVVDQTAFGATTDDDGRYAITGVPTGVYAVTARRIGLAPERRENVRVAADATTTVDFALRRNVLQLEQVVSTGVVDPTSGRKVPFTVARVGGEELEVPANNALASIQGKIAGASIVQSSAPGSGTNILLRTPTTITKSNSPLIVVDGVILSNSFGASSADLDALDIESIEVVKGAAAASLYGSRAANGVIQIRTKRGTGLADGQTRFTVRTEYGANQLNGEIGTARYHNFMTNAAGEYVDDEGNVVERGDREQRPASERFQDVAYVDPLYSPATQLFDPGAFSSATVTLAQGGTSTNFYASVSTHHTEGVILDTDGYRKNDFRLNLDHRLRDDLQFSFSGYHMRSELDDLPSGLFLDLIQQAPDINLLQPDPDGTPYIYQPDVDEGHEPSPLYTIAVTRDVEERARTLGNLRVRYSPLSWLSADGDVSYDRSDRNYDYVFPRGRKTTLQARQNGYLSRTTGTTNTLNASVSANLLGAFGDLTTRTTVRALMEQERNDVLEAEAFELTVEGTPDLDVAGTRQISSSFEDVRSNGFFLITGADWRGKYIADAVIRRDGSSLFGPEDRWHTYYRASLAYRMAEEPWWPIEQIGEFKLRVSQGTAGNRPDYLNRFETLTIDAETGALGGGNTLGNRALRPEQVKETEIGLDVIALERLSLQLNYATTTTTDALLLVPLPAAFGFRSQWRNAGSLEGHTFEATAEAVLYDRNDTRWSLGFVADRSRHRVTQFDRPCYNEGAGNFYYCEGARLGSMYGQSFATDPSQLAAAAAGSGEFQVNDDGLLVWVGPGGDYRDAQWGTTGTLGGNEYDWGMPILLTDNGNTTANGGQPLAVRIGDSNPDWHFGISNSVRWKFVNVYGLVDIQRGGDVYNRTKQRMYQYYRSSDVDQAGKPEAEKKTTDYYSVLYNGNTQNSWFVEDASFVKLRELSVRLEAPESWRGYLAGVGAERVALSLIGRNLLTWSSYSGYDPEVGSPLARVDDFVYPQFRTLTAALEVAF